MLLPTGTEKKDMKLYEEVTVPPSSPAHKLPCETERVPIASLDEVSEPKFSESSKTSRIISRYLPQIGQEAFAGMASLNRIQSMVFDTAYKSNENLLICAPTGAGKTNVAMLTVVHELKQHIEQGVIKKDEFKVLRAESYHRLRT